MAERLMYTTLFCVCALFLFTYAVAQQSVPLVTPDPTSEAQPLTYHIGVPQGAGPAAEPVAQPDGPIPEQKPISSTPVLQQQIPIAGTNLPQEEADAPATGQRKAPFAFGDLFANNSFFRTVAPGFTPPPPMKTDNPFPQQTGNAGLPYPYNLVPQAYPGYPPYQPYPYPSHPTHHKKPKHPATKSKTESSETPVSTTAADLSKRHRVEFTDETPTPTTDESAQPPKTGDSAPLGDEASTTVDATTQTPTPFYKTFWVQTASAVPSSEFFGKTLTGLLKFTPLAPPSGASGTELLYAPTATENPQSKGSGNEMTLTILDVTPTTTTDAK